MSDKSPDVPGPTGDLRREIEQKVDELEQRLAYVERQLAERARLIREGQPWNEDAPTPPDPPDPIAD